MAAKLPLKVGSSDARGDDVTHWQKWAKGYAKAYADLMGPVDGYFGNSDAMFVREMKTRLIASGHRVPLNGEFDAATAAIVGYRARDIAVAQKLRPIYLYSLPGSGASWWMGPPHEAGSRVARDYGLVYQPVGFPMGGYLGLLGGDPGLSYNEVIAGAAVEVERLLSVNPDVVSKNPDVEFWWFCYSQSADATKCAVRDLFGDANETAHGIEGRFKHLRSRINGIVAFGDPTRRPGPTKVGNNPKGWGIARKTFPVWLEAKTWSITTNGDMYACTTDDTLLPLFYEWFVKAETELSFVGYSAGIIIPALASYFQLAAPILGALGMVPLMALAGAAGVGAGMLGQLIGTYGGGDSPNPELIDALSAKGLLTPQGIRRVVATLAALPGIQTHGEYHLPKPEFNGRTGIDVAYSIVADFRR